MNVERTPHRLETDEMENRTDIRDKHDIPLSLVQPRLIEPLKIDDLLLEPLVSLEGGQVLRGRHASSHFANARERRARDELAQEVAARLASGAEDECRFRASFDVKRSGFGSVFGSARRSSSIFELRCNLDRDKM
jgi:hypothetical protein